MDFNKYSNLTNGTTIVELSQGQWMILDTVDWDGVKEMKWFAKLDHKLGGYYAHHTTSRKHGKQKTIRLHRLIMKVDSGTAVDHVSGETLDNRRSNLRIDYDKRNNQNYRKPRHNKSGYKGVSWYKRTNSWLAQIMVRNKKYGLGLFKDINEAIKVYELASCYYFKEFAKYNFPERKEEYLKIINANHIDSHLSFKTLI